MFFNGASRLNERGGHLLGARVLFILPNSQIRLHSFTLSGSYSNNLTEYQALIMGMELDKAMHLTHLRVFGDSKLIINKLVENIK